MRAGECSDLQCRSLLICSWSLLICGRSLLICSVCVITHIRCRSDSAPCTWVARPCHGTALSLISEAVHTRRHPRRKPAQRLSAASSTAAGGHILFSVCCYNPESPAQSHKSAPQGHLILCQTSFSKRPVRTVRRSATLRRPAHPALLETLIEATRSAKNECCSAARLCAASSSMPLHLFRHPVTHPSPRPATPSPADPI